jgi:topoisomerase-4 subunit A
VLTSASVPKVLNLKEVLQEYLDHRHQVLLRKSRYRLGKIDHRLEVLAGYLIAYLNLDEVIRIIREEDHPKPVLMARFDLSDVQAEAILNMRLRSLRKLEEMEIRKEHDALSKEKAQLQALLDSEKKRWKAIAKDITEMRAMFAETTALGKRRTTIADAPKEMVISVEAFVEKEPITVLCSQMGWIRAVKGTFTEMPDAKYKEGDEARFVIPTKTTEKLIIFASNGRFYTIPASKIPKGKGHGEPLRLLIDLEGEHEVVAMFEHHPERELLVASTSGKGFRIMEADVVAQTKQGKQILGLSEGARALLCRPVVGDHVAVIGSNRKLLVFPLTQIPPMKKGQGVQLQKYKDGELSDVQTFALKEGLSWEAGSGRIRTETDIKSWLGVRASAGKLPPTGFPRSNQFGDTI